MKNNWFDEQGNLKITSEEFYCNLIFPYDDEGCCKIKREIVEFIMKNYTKYDVNSDIVKIYYAIYFGGDSHSYMLLWASGITDNVVLEKLEARHP